MPPHLVQRMVQYSAPARPPMTRRTRNWPSQSGQLDRTSAGELASESYMAGLPLILHDHRSLVEIVDTGLRIGDRRVRIGPGKPDFQFGKRDAVDDDGLIIRAPDPGVPKAFSSLERLDLKAVIVHVASPAVSNTEGKHETGRTFVNWFTSFGRSFGPGRSKAEITRPQRPCGGFYR